jgi:hypothetical protein
LDANVCELLNGGGKVTTVGLGGEQLTPCTTWTAPHTLQVRRAHGHPVVGHPHEENGHRTSAPEEASEPRQSKSVTLTETVKEHSPLLPQITEKTLLRW